MPRWSNSSKAKLATCHTLIQNVMNEVIKHFDCKIIFGHRTSEEQYELYLEGRTQRDGYTKLSYHNYSPSLAVDVAPYPIQWPDEDGITEAEAKDRLRKFQVFGGFVLGVARAMDVPLFWGNDWDGDWDMLETKFRDLPHFELHL